MSDFKVIVLLMIKNESRIIRRSIQSALKIADAVCISDTGSTDDTVKLLDEFYPTLSIPCKTPPSDQGSEGGMLQGMQRIPCKTFQHQWTNFGINRSLSFQDASALCHELNWDPTRTYALAIDADMELVVEPSFNKQQDLGLKGYSLTQKANSLHYINARLLRLDQPWTCKGCTHEYWDGPMEGNVSDSKLWINDRNDGGCKADKFTRDLTLLQQELVEQPTNVRTHFYLAQTFKCLGRFDESIEFYKRRIALGGWYEEVWYSYYMIAWMFMEQKKYEEAELWVLKGHAFSSYRAENLYLLVKHFRIIGQQWKSMHYYLEAKKVRKPQIALFLESEVYDHLLDYENTVLQYYVNSADRKEGLRSCVRYLQHPKSTQFLENVFSNIEFYASAIVNDRTSIVNESRPLQFPQQGEFTSSSCSLAMHQGQLLMNVRYVNYHTSEKGIYSPRSEDKIVRTQNAFLPAIPGAYPPILSVPYVQEDPSLRQYSTNILGLEDIRITSHKGTLFYTATSKSSTPDTKYRIVFGKYGNQLTESIVLESPTNSECEKNWLTISDLDLSSEAPLFIHKWHPFEVGRLEGTKLNITTRFQTSPYFSKLRGSANPVLFKDEYWCLVHFVKYGDPRKYYHQFVLLDKTTLKPLKLSMPFYFKNQGIEYCTGMHVDESGTQFVYSSFDANPCLAKVPLSAFEFLVI